MAQPSAPPVEAARSDTVREAISPGLSEFLGRVLDQLSLTAWLPAVMLVGNAALLLQLGADPNSGIADALAALTEKPLGVLVVLTFAVVLAALVTQALEFSAIRLQEGYWGHSKAAHILSGWRISRHLARKEKLLTAGHEAEGRAFGAARQTLEAAGVSPAVTAAIAALHRGQAISDFPDHVQRDAADVDWYEYAPAAELRRMEALDRAHASYPEDSRVLPTRLGNALRSTEDQLHNVGAGPLRGFVIRNLVRIPPSLLAEHDQYRNRLDMYCMFALVCAGLAVLAPALLLTRRDDLGFGLASAGMYALLAWAGYRAAVASARGYATTLQALDDSLSTPAP